MTKNDSRKSTIRIWDLPTRLFHILFALSVAGALISVKLAGAWMDWHLRFGISALALLVFRIIWGFVGPRYARFGQFVKSPAQTWQYLRASRTYEQKHAGHNPLGAWSVLAMLGLIGVQATTGLFTSDEILTQGPFTDFVSEATSALMGKIHHLNETPIYIVLVMHLVAVAFYSIKRHGLVKPMITGDVNASKLPAETPATTDGLSIRLVALLIALILSYIAHYLIKISG